MIGAGSRKRGARTPYGKEELKLVHQALRSQRLFRWSGKMVSNFEKEFAQAYGVPYAVASTSGTSAIHVALGALNLNPGDEIITTPITDIGTIIPILAQNAIPVFADIDDRSYNISPVSIEQHITERTKAVIVVHVFGNPCDMDAIMSICRQYNLPVVEDCSQAHVTEYRGNYVGTMGDFGCYSFQESKHLTTGDGGMTITRNSSYYERMQIFADKGFDRNANDDRLTHRFHAPNYRMTELTAAVGLAQLDKVVAVVKRRNQLGSMLTKQLSEVGGVRPAPVTPGGSHAYWSYPLYLEEIDVSVFLKEMEAASVPAAAHMTTPVYFTAESLRSKSTYGSSKCPFTCVNSIYEYDSGLCPKAEGLSKHLVNLWLNENWNEKDVQRTVEAVKRCVKKLTNNGARTPVKHVSMDK